MNYRVNFAQEIRRAANNGTVEAFRVDFYQFEGLPPWFAEDEIVDPCQIHSLSRSFVWLERKIPASLIKTGSDFLACFAEKKFARRDILKLRDVPLQETKNVFVTFYAEDRNFFSSFDNARGVSDICSDVDDCEAGKLLFHQHRQSAEFRGLMAVPHGKRRLTWYLNGIAADLDGYCFFLRWLASSERFPTLFSYSVNSQAKRR